MQKLLLIILLLSTIRVNNVFILFRLHMMLRIILFAKSKGFVAWWVLLSFSYFLFWLITFIFNFEYFNDLLAKWFLIFKSFRIWLLSAYIFTCFLLTLFFCIFFSFILISWFNRKNRLIVSIILRRITSQNTAFSAS